MKSAITVRSIFLALASCTFEIHVGAYMSTCVSDDQSRRRENETTASYNNHRFEGRAGSGLHGPLYWDSACFFFFSPGAENQCARRTRNREINHCALMNRGPFDPKSDCASDMVRIITSKTANCVSDEHFRKKNVSELRKVDVCDRDVPVSRQRGEAFAS